MSVLPKISWPVPSSNSGNDFANQEALMSHLEGEATGWYMVGSNGMWHGGIHITSTTTPWCALSGKTASELLDFPVPFKGEQSVRCMADGEVVAYRICREYLTVPWETGPLSVSGSFVLVRHYIQPGEKKENGLHFYTLYMHLAPYSAYASTENETHWIVNDKLPVFRREWTPDASAETRNTYRVATIPKGSLIEWDATEASRSATGPKARRYGLVTFKGLSDKAKAKGTQTSLVEGQQYWILTDRDNLVPSSGVATRPSWWSHLLPPYAEPMQFDTVVCPTPYPISAGESIGHLGYFQIPKEGGYDVRYQVHIECLSDDDTLPAFLKNPEKVGENTPLYLKCPSGLPLFSKDLKTKAMVSSGRTSQGEAVLKLGQVKTEKDAQGMEYWFLPYANGYVPKSNASVETLSQYDLGKLGFTTTVDEAPSFDHLDGTTSPKGVVRSILNRLLDASSADTRLTHRTVPYNYQRLLNRIDSSISPYSSQEYLSAIHNPSYRDVKNKMIVKHPSEWYHKKETSVWQSFLNKLTSDAPEWREYCEGYLDKMVWMQDASKLKLGSSLWHMHPVEFLGALASHSRHKKRDYDLGSLSSKYETGGRGSQTVSGGQGDAGGVSYGSYQMTSKTTKRIHGQLQSVIGGTVKIFVSDSTFKWRNEFDGLIPGAPPFTSKWKELVKNNPTEFKDIEHEFIKKTHFDKLVEHTLKESDVDIRYHSHTLNDVVWSTAVQHGPQNNIIINAIKAVGEDVSETKTYDKALINAIYDERSKKNSDGNLVYFSKNSASVQAGVSGRFVSEKKEALERLSNEKDY